MRSAVLVAWWVMVGVVKNTHGQSCQADYSMLLGAVDSVVLVDTDNSCIRMLSFGGDLTLLAGVPGSPGFLVPLLEASRCR
jgi:hypothetical protein